MPHLTTGIKSITTTAELVLLVEKDTVYKQLLSANYSKHLRRSSILITVKVHIKKIKFFIIINTFITLQGKGYPDTNTRVMLHKIWSNCRLPIYALFDADPHGIEIMLVYRHGSLAMSPWVDHMAVPSIRWAGLRPSEIAQLGLNTLQMCEGDRRRVRQMLQRPYICEQTRAELQVLLCGDRKAEIESLVARHRSYLVDTYLPEKLNLN